MGKDKKKKRLWERLVQWKNSFLSAVSERGGEIKHAKAKRIAASVVLALFILFFIAFYFLVGKQLAFLIKDPQGFKAWIKGFGRWHVVTFIGLRVIQTAFKLIPGEPLEIAAGCAFGTWGGLFWCLVGSFLGSVLILFLGKRYGQKMVGLFVSPEHLKMAAIFKDGKGLNFLVFILFFIPGLPKDMFVWLFSLTDEKPYKFLLISTVARIPSIVTSTWCGHELISENYLSSAIIFIISALLAVFGGAIYAYHRKKKAAEDEATTNEKNGSKKADPQI